MPPVEFDGRGGHYYPPHHHRDGVPGPYRGYPPGYPPGALPPPSHRGDGRGSDRYEGGVPPGPMGMPARAYHGDPGSRRERSRDYAPPPEVGSERSPKSSRESRSRERRRHAEAITTPLVVSREEGKDGARLEAEGTVKSRKRSKDKEEKLLRHKHHHKSKESRKESKEAAAAIQEGVVKKSSKTSLTAPPDGEKQATETRAEESSASSKKEVAKISREAVKAEGEETLSESAVVVVKERKHKHKKKLKQEEALRKMAAKMASRTSDDSSQQLPGTDEEPLKRKKKKKKLREARLLMKSLPLTSSDLLREQSMVAFLTAELEQGVPDAARLSMIEEQLELAKKKLLSDETEETKGEVATPEETRAHAGATQGTVDTIWDKTELEQESKENVVAPKEEENVLQVEVPELSKWEREELEGEESPLPPSEPIEEAKETKPVVSSEVLQRAENVLLHKPRKKAMVAVAAATAALARPATAPEPKKLPSKVASPDDSRPVPAEESSSQSSVREVKEGWRDSSVPLRLRDRLDGTLQVTITASSEKERRSVTTSDKEQRGSSSEGTQQTKRIKLDRSKFGEKHSRREGGEASDGAKPSKSSSRRDDRSGGRMDDRAPSEHDRRFPPDDIRSRLEDRRALEAGGHSRVLPPARSDRDLSRSSRSGRPREKESSHRSSSRDVHSDERRRHKEERYYAAMMEERARRAYEEAHYKRMEVEMSHSRRKAPDEHRSRHAAEDVERLRMHERRGEAPRLRSKSADRGSGEDHHRSRRGDWSGEQTATTGSVVSQPPQRSRSKDRSERSPRHQRHHKEKTSHVAVSSTASVSAAGGSAASDQEIRATSSTAAKQTEKKLSPTSPSLETLRHRKESTQDESRFEPDYDEMIEDEPGSGGTADPTLSQGARGGSTKRRAVAVIETLAGKKSRLAEEEALAPVKPSASPATSTTAPAVSAVVALAAPAVSADDDRSSSSSSDSSDDEVTSHKKHKKKHKKHKKHKHKHKKKKKSKKAEKSD